jgi:ligand-binding SRPBCC domain-containing protein
LTEYRARHSSPGTCPCPARQGERTSELRLREPDARAAETLFAWHERPGAFERLAPPWERIEVLEREGGIRDGGRLVMTLRKGPFRLRWVAEHFGYEEGREFRDRQASGPFASWVHRHRCLPDGDGSRLRDEIEWRLRGGARAAFSPER